MNTATGATREAVSGTDGAATIAALPLTGTYTVSVSKAGFHRRRRHGPHAARGRNGDGEGEAASPAAARPRSPSTARPRACAPIRRSAAGSTARPSTRRRSSAARSTTLPLLNSAFRQGKGTGDLFVNATYFITGAGSRRTTTFTLDGANNDEAWGRQTMIATVPLGAIQEMTVLSNAFSAEFGWTAGPALNIVTKSGTNALHGEGLYHEPSRRQAGEDVLDRRLLPAVGRRAA